MTETVKVSGEELAVIDELCSCGHLKSAHSGSLGHGYCRFCISCKKFTFVGFVLVNPEVADKYQPTPVEW